MTESVLADLDANGTATLTFNRPDIHNAFDDELIARLTDELDRLEQDSDVRCIVLRANGKSFSAGADVNWMRRMADYSENENFQDAMALGELMRSLHDICKPTLALVQGAAYGGGVGLVACCDIAIANHGATFCLSEVRLGLVPAVISPYVVQAIGARASRRYFLTGEVFDSAEAYRLGLVHAVVASGGLEAAADAIVTKICQGGPQAQSASKRLIATVERAPLDDALVEETAHRIANIRASAEGREGLQAFVEKREPAWRKGR
jgi:methylglutaconyl-CoA hydratase